MLLEVLPLLFNYHISKICTWYSRVIGISNTMSRPIVRGVKSSAYRSMKQIVRAKNAALEYAIQVGPIGLQISHFSAIAGARSLQFSRWT